MHYGASSERKSQWPNPVNLQVRYSKLHLAVKKHGVASPYEPSANDHGSLRHPVDGFDHTNDRLVCKSAI